MRRILLALALLAAAPAAAQPMLYPGQNVISDLSSSDPTLGDGSHFDLWRFQAEAHHVYLVTLRSPSFDAFLAVGSSARDGCSGCRTNDDGGGGTDAAVRFTPDAPGAYEVRANSYGAGETGEYNITLEDEGLAPEVVVTAPVMVQAGDTVQGRLQAGDEMYGSGYTDTYLYDGRAGETVVVTLRSADFDAVVAMGRPEHRGCRPIDSDDDGAGGTDSKLKVTISQDGTYHIHVRTAGAGSGDYTLTVERQ
jgi:hypothetical protein